MKSNLAIPQPQESYIIELLKILLPYKWFIISMMILFMLLAKVYLYFVPSLYQSYAIIKIKEDRNNHINREDILEENLYKINNNPIEEQMDLLKTYQMNKSVIDESSLEVEYFMEKAYKMVELYMNSPIELVNLKKTSEEFLWKHITLYPKKNGFTLGIKKLEDKTVYPYNKSVKTPYFTATIIKTHEFTSPIYIKINGNSREIYEGVISKKLNIARINPNSNLIILRYDDTIPERANHYIDTLIKRFITKNIKDKNNKNNKILNFLNERLAIVKAKLDQSEGALEKYKSKNKNIAPAVNSTDSINKLGDIDLKLSELQLQKKLIQNLLIFIEHNKNLDAIAPTLLEFNDQTTIRLINTLQDLQANEAELQLEYTDNYPELIKLRKRIERTKKKIHYNIQNLQSILVSKGKNLLRQKHKYENRLKELPKKEKNLIRYQRDYNVNSKLYNYLLEKKSEYELIKVATTADYEIVDSAYTSSTPIKPKRLTFIALAGIIGLGLATFISFIRLFMVDKIQRNENIKLLTSIPVYGEIPLYKEKMLTNISLREAYRKLAINLQFKKKREEGNIILFTSTTKGEGKTTSLVNVASIFQQTPTRTIIIDLNMYQPTVHSYFGLEPHYPGVSTYLSQRDNLNKVISTTNYPNLDVIIAGPTPPNPLELLLSPKLEELFAVLKREYDYILIDTASLDIAPEIYYLMQYTDMNLIVLRENYTKKSAILNLEREIKEKSLNNIGLILQVTPKKSRQLLSQSSPKLVREVKKRTTVPLIQ